MFLNFSSFAEFYVYVTCVLLGISDLMPLNALTSAPSYMILYYKYATGDPDAVPNNPKFWANILTFYNLSSVVTQALVGPTVLMPWVRRFSLTVRFIFALIFMMLEVVVILLLPAGHTTQNGAMAAFFIVSIAAGAGKSYLEATCYALVGTMPPKFMSAIMFGCGFSGVIASVLQCIVKVSMDNSYYSTLHQAYIYFSVALGIMVVALFMALSLRFNRFAQEYVGEFRSIKSAKDAAKHVQDAATGDATGAGENATASGAHSDERHPYGNAPPHVEGEVYGDIIMEDKELKARRKAEGAEEPSEDDEVQEVRRYDGSVVGENPAEDRNLTTAEQLQRTSTLPVIKIIWPCMLSCFWNFFVSLLILPSLIIPVDRTDNWFATIAILLYNCGDALGRWSSSLRFLWPSRCVLLICVAVRTVFIMLTFLCIYKYIPGHVAPYIIFACLGLTNGFFGATSMVLGPIDSRLRTEGQRVMAGQLMGISLLTGASVSALLALLIVLYLP